MQRMDLDVLEEYHHIITVDLSWIMHKNYHALQNISAVVDGQEIKTGHIYGPFRLVNTLKNIYEDCAVVLCADSFPEEKHKIYAGYKGGRDNKYFNLHDCTAEVAKLCCCLGDIFVAVSKGIEADEVIFSIVNKYKRKHTVLSGDYDLSQIFNIDDRNVEIATKLTKYQKEFRSVEMIEKKFKVDIKDLLFFRVLTGDTSDKIPRIVSNKAAKEAIAEYKDINNYVSHNGDMRKKVMRNLALMELRPMRFNLWISELKEALKVARKYSINSFLKVYEERSGLQEGFN
jgi:5'-3' exonuclease